MNNLFLPPQYLKILTDIFDQYCPQAEIWAYGSRVNGNAHEASDLDLVVKNFNCDTAQIYELKSIINDSNIPILVDLNEYDNLPSSFQKEICKKYVVIYG